MASAISKKQYTDISLQALPQLRRIGTNYLIVILRHA
jgi:hypothetical protein